MVYNDGGGGGGGASRVGRYSSSTCSSLLLEDSINYYSTVDKSKSSSSGQLIFFAGIFTEDVEARSLAIISITDHLVSQVERLYPGDSLHFPNSSIYAREEEEFRANLLTVLRLSIDSPFADVRSSFQTLLQELKAPAIPRAVHKAPSIFLPAKLCPGFFDEDQVEQDEKDEELVFSDPAWSRRILVREYLEHGRVLHVFRLLCFFPSYLERYQHTFSLLIGNGPLPQTWRYYIGVLAAAEFPCQYLYSVSSVDFLRHGGDASWLVCLQNAPPKLQRLARLNSLLARTPYLLRNHHLAYVVKGPENDSWNMAEIMQALVLLSTFHALSSFCLAVGVAPELDVIGGSIPATEELAEDVFGLTIPDEQLPVVEMATKLEIKNETSTIFKRLKSVWQRAKSFLKDKEGGDISTVTAGSLMETDDAKSYLSDDLLRAVSRSGSTDLGFGLVGSGSGVGSTDPETMVIRRNPILQDLSKLKAETLLTTNVDADGQLEGLLQLEEYNWEDYGVELVSRYLPGVGESLDELFEEVKGLTDFNFSTVVTVMDTQPLRQAIWFFVMQILKIQRDDYDIRQISRFLTRPMLSYLRKLTYTPEHLDSSDLSHFGVNLRADERIHVTILGCEAKRQAELLFCLCALFKDGH